MKNLHQIAKALLPVLFLFSGFHGYAQEGIFLSAMDYQNNRIISVQKMNLNHLLSGKYVEVVRNGKELRYSKDSIFGYRDEHGKNYRFYRKYDDEYQIEEQKSMVIYILFIPRQTSKGLAEPMEPTYFFSKTLDDEIKPLSMENLINTWPDNHNFHHLLGEEFEEGASLSLYDSEHKMFRINYLLKETLNK